MIRSLVVLVLAAALVGCGGGSEVELERFDVESRLLGRSLEQIAIDPGGHGRPLLVLLHGHGGDPDDVASNGLLEELERLGDRAPAVLLVNGDHSYYHDRADGQWGSYVLDEAIPAGVRRLRADGRRVAIGGFSMGGFGAFDLARLRPARFCAVGGHSPALWRTGGETPVGAFDDAADFDRHDLFGDPLGAGLRVWLDVGADDSFHDATVAYADLLSRSGAHVTAHVWPGDHSSAYWREHLSAYLEFYVSALADCR